MAVTRSDASSLRHRRAQDDEAISGGAVSISRSVSRQQCTGIRLNKVLGRVVPLILLTYVYYAYDLVVIRYGLQYLYHKQQMGLTAAVWLVVLHLLFLTALRSYFHVFFAHAASLSCQQPQTLMNSIREKLGASFEDPHPSEMSTYNDPALFSGTIGLCNPDGSPVRCFRDQCNGRVKAFRTRHCGDCGTCRIGFDHHCAWFDNDITAPATLRSFLLFLGCVPPLIGLALGPLVPSAWRTTRLVASFALDDANLKKVWWSRWYGWLGGPVFRWMVGWCIGARRWSKSSLDNCRLPHQIVSGPLLVGFGAVLVIIASSLACSTILNLSAGLLTVDVERAKAFKSLSRRRKKLILDIAEGRRQRDNEYLKDLDAKMLSLAPVSYFRVTSTKEHPTRQLPIVVAVNVGDGLFSRSQAKANLRYFLWDREARKQMKHGCSLSQQAFHHVTATISQNQASTVK